MKKIFLALALIGSTAAAEYYSTTRTVSNKTYIVEVGDSYAIAQIELDQNIKVRCKIDEMDDLANCYVIAGNAKIEIHRSTKFNGYRVVMHGDHYPESKITVRIDKNKAIIANENSGFTKAQSAAIVSQIKIGDKITTRYYDWPYKSSVDKTTLISDLGLAVDVLDDLYALTTTN